MAVSDMEPWAVKTLLLLYSKSEDSTEQLRQMLEESIKQKYGVRKLSKPVPGPSYNKKTTVGHRSPRDVEETTSVKKFRGPKHIKSELEIETVNWSSDTSTEDSDDGMEILEADLACIICREMACGPRNRLIECSECHCLYHQDCHTPHITDMDVSDPRHVWYCTNCSKALSKSKSSSVSVASSSNSSNSNSSSSSKHSYKTSSSSSSSSGPRTSQTPPAVPFGTNKNYSGMSLHNKKSSSSSKSSPNYSKSVNPNINNIISADRRLQIMKKRAAKKQEKRIHPK